MSVNAFNYLTPVQFTNHKDYFHLDPDFISQYTGKKPNFGFNGLGEFVYYRTYSRKMDDGKKETFVDTLVRVVEGCYEIQRRHCRAIHIPWDYEKAQESAQEMFRRMWDFKFLPPGRGLWMMGTKFMWERGSAALNNCFDGSTQIITKEGVKEIGPLVDTVQELLTIGGKWVEAPIKSFGVQKLWRLIVKRGDVIKTILTTEDHLWYVRRPGRAANYDKPIATSQLRRTNILQSVFEGGAQNRNNDEDWVVVSVADIKEEAEVFCPQVLDYNAFVLADNILTHNCGFVSTDDKIESDPSEPFCFLMDMSMLGVGVGFDTKGAGKIQINQPADKEWVFAIPDSREGWVDSVRQLIRSYTIAADSGHVIFDYSAIRPAGATIEGFGGKAAGAGILEELHGMIASHLEKLIGNAMSSVDITDIMNYIGRCIVAGNVRRCLPKGTLIHTKRGLVPIEKVQVGDLVLTSDGYHPVSENVYQGKQEVVTIKTQMGDFRCTAKHRIAVMTSFNQYDWKRAYELVDGDRMVFVDDVVPGTPTTLPRHNWPSKRGVELTVPSLNAIVAWFIGAVHGDGYIYPGRSYKGRKNHGASVMIPVNRDEYHDDIVNKINAGFDMFGFSNPGEQPSQDNAHKVRVISRQLSHYFYANFKQARTPLGVPECIKLSEPHIRAAYLAGLLDSDGSTKNRPTTLMANIYYDFLKEVQAVYASLGIPTKLKKRREASENESTKWELSLVGEHAIMKFKIWVEPHATKKLKEQATSGHDYGYPAQWVLDAGVKYGKSWCPDSAQMTYSRASLCGVEVGKLIPVEVNAVIKEGIVCETYDLSVPDRNEFVAEGMLVHNTAEIAFGEGDDAAYCNMKNAKYTLLVQDYAEFDKITNGLYAVGRNEATIDDFAHSNIPLERLAPAIETWNANNHHRWASNNSIFATVGMNYEWVGKAIATNGEPGLLWLDNMRDYGRMKDGKQPGIDGRVMGGNPCLEQSLESYELCNLVETFPANHADAEDYMRTLKFAYLYAKTVTLLPTHNPRTNQVTLRNRRIGLSQSGIVQAFSKFGRRAFLHDFCDTGYNEVRRWDKIYAEWLCVQQSIKVTSVKPSGSVSLLVGCSPGLHYPEATTYWRTVRVAKGNVLLDIMTKAGYKVEPSITDGERTMVVYFGVDDRRSLPVNKVSLWQQVTDVVAVQRYWADNQVSYTAKFNAEEAGQIANVLEAYEDELKGISFLPQSNHGYPQAPYIPCEEHEVRDYNANITDADYSSYIMEAVGSVYCDNESCALPN
jgi:intein/homing endonuclease